MFSENPRDGTCKRKGNANIKVCVRLRPPNEAEHNEKFHTVTHAISDHMLVFDPKVQAGPGVLQAKPRDVNRHRFKDLKYAFDYVFGPQATNRDVFEHTTKGIVSGVLNGYNCSVFAYGATGAGKTHTMLGNVCEPGVIYFTMMDLYRRIEEQKQDKVFDVAVSYSEVYNEQVRDLLIPRGNLPIREDKTVGVIIAGLSLHKPKTAEELLHMLQFGNKNRTQHPTDANAESSRSHAVFQVFVNQRDKLANGNTEVVMAKMCLVDLAGSERAHHTTNCGVRFRESANINRSLLALGNVINALADNKFKGHIPYRDSKLTRLLKDSLGGNCRTVMIAAVSPSSRSFEDTYNTLRYADRAKHIRADIKKNVMSVDFHIANYKKYVQDLERQNQELRRSKQSLLESLEKAEACSGQGISPILRQFQERLKDLFKVRRDIRKVQMESEGAKRELKWKVSRREQAIKRIQHLTGSQNILSKHGRVIERMKKRIDKEEQSLKDSTHRMQEQDNAISRAITEFSTTEGKQAPELLDLNARAYILESNLHDIDMYLAFTKKLARAQERQASVTEGLVTSLLQLAKKQHDVLHSQDLLSPELQSKYDQCCCLVEERGVAFTQHPPGSSPRQQGGGEDCGGKEGGVSPSDAAAAGEDGSLGISDIIDIQIPKLRVQDLIQTMVQVKPQEPQRVMKPVSAVRPAARVTSTQMQEAVSSASPVTQHQPGLVSQGTFSKDSSHQLLWGPAGQMGHPATALEPLKRSQETYHGGGGSTNHMMQGPARAEPQRAALPVNGRCQRSTLSLTHLAVGPENTRPRQLASSSNHHQFPVCTGPVPTLRQKPSSPPPPSPSLEWAKPGCLKPPPSPEATSSTDNLNNTFQVLKPALPNTPCIDGVPRDQNHCHHHHHPPAQLATCSNTPHPKKLVSDFPLVQRLDFQGACEVQRPTNKALSGQGDGQEQAKPHPAGLSVVRQSPGRSRAPASTSTFGLAGALCQPGLSETPVGKRPQPSALTLGQRPETNRPTSPQGHVRRPGAAGSARKQANINNGNSHCILSTSPKSYAEALKSPASCHTSLRTPTSAKPPVRVKLTTSMKDSGHQVAITTPDFSLCQLKQKLELTCEKLPARVEPANLGCQSKPIVVRRPLELLDPNSKVKPYTSTDMKSKSASSLVNPTKDFSSGDSNSQPLPGSCLAVPITLDLKSRPQRVKDRRHHRAMAASNPYSIRRHRRWAPHKPGEVTGGNTGHGDATAIAVRPSYMQPTFARSQKMLGLDLEKPPQRQAANAPLTRRTFLHKQRFAVA